ncbi:hypothetical protein B296_00005203 [Ensete ventricosum]|uniref:Retrotransposon gag domain-containing protein n=1 Tax=Ensete ventricosum TaxID=4639 RepID=A0A427AYP4_ENSVE|nr:hypothetical protein B296_00005203 [Ensete ventricosum]
MDSLRAQLRQVNPRLDEVQKEFVKSNEELRESSKGGSPFAPEIQDKPILTNFCLPSLESYDGSSDQAKHVASFWAQMALYDTLNTLMCRAFPTTLRGLARIWYNRLKSSLISSFDQLTKEFELNFLGSARPRPTAASLLDFSQGSEESLAQFVGRFAVEIRGVPDTHPSLVIQAFLMGLRPFRFFWLLVECPPTIVLEMLQQANQYIVVETLVARKRDDQKRPRAEQSRGQPSSPSRRRIDKLELSLPRPPSIPLSSTRT